MEHAAFWDKMLKDNTHPENFSSECDFGITIGSSSSNIEPSILPSLELHYKRNFLGTFRSITPTFFQW